MPLAASRTADVVVVGSGLSGLAVAAQLLSLGVRDVCVLEGGSGQTTSAPYHRPWTSATPPHYAASGGLRQGVGGRSLYWHGVVLRLEAWALDDPCWPAAVRTALLGPGPGRDGLYDRVEAELSQWIEDSPMPSGQAAAESVFAGWLSGVAPGPVLPVPRAVRRWLSAGQDHQRAYTPLDQWRERGGSIGSDRTPTIVPDANAVEVLLARGRPSGVLFHDLAGGGHKMVACSRVVLAAGTIENTRLVAQLASQFDAERVAYSGLNDHLTQGFVVSVPASRLPLRARSGAFALVARDRQWRCNVFVRLHAPEPGGPARLLDVWAMGEQVRSPINQVSFPQPQQPPWPVLIRAGLSSADEAVVAGERELLSDLWARLRDLLRLPATPLRFGDFLTAPRPFDGAYRAALRARGGAPFTYTWPLGVGDHEGGTLPLGERLDDHGRLPWAPEVFVVGPATFPRAGAANPSLTTLALAAHTAQALGA